MKIKSICICPDGLVGGCLDAQMDGWTHGLADGRKKEKKKVLAGYFPCLLKLGGLIFFFLQMLLKQSFSYDQDTVKV